MVGFSEDVGVEVATDASMTACCMMRVDNSLKVGYFLTR